jgi:hypothetical protein
MTSVVAPSSRFPKTFRSSDLAVLSPVCRDSRCTQAVRQMTGDRGRRAPLATGPHSRADCYTGTSQSAASGGSVTSAEWYWLIHDTFSVSMSPRLPWSEPP